MSDVKRKRLCSVDGCARKHYGHGWCAAHYRRWQRHGSPLGGGTPYGEPERYLQEVVLPHVGDDCLIWPYARDSAGYANLQSSEGRPHRRACAVRNGPPPTPQHEAAHSCGRGGDGCVNPSHLRWATHQENMADKVLHGTQPRGEKCNLSKLTEQDVRTIRKLGGTMLQREIADMFGVRQGLISRLLAGKAWSWLT